MEFTAREYIADVLAGRVLACKWTRLACERHIRDLETGQERGLWFDEETAKIVIAFFSLLKHSKGEWAGTPIILEPWQQAHLWMLFGWKRADNTRRFRTSYLEVARKNGKSTLAAGVGLYLLIADGEAGAEIYTAATKFDQAKIIHSEAVRMVRQSADLLREVGLFKDNIHSEATFSKYEPLGADSKTLDGLNAHAALIDEVHAHPNRDLWDILRTSQGARRQPLMYAITTAGYDQTSFCYEMHRYTQQVLENVIQDDSFYGIIYSLDEEDKWQDEATWIKANPNLGVSKKLEKMREEAREAEHVPSALNTFLRLHLDLWTKAEHRWVKLAAWDACTGPTLFNQLPGYLAGRECYAGLDMASTIDIAALVLVFPPRPGEDVFTLLPYLWIPEENMPERSHRDQVPYEAWVREGLIEATEGNVIDYGAIKNRIQAVGQAFFLREIAFDRWGAFQISQDLAALGMTVVPFGQGYASMSAPMKELLKLILDQKLAHGGHPVLRWMADNLVVETDAAGNIKPSKAKSRQKIDGIVASIMGLDRAIRLEGKRESVYEERGLRTL
jgi:phage terminase large subunit-like protein